MAQSHGDKCVVAMGDELGSLFKGLEEEVDWLSHKWSEFRELFLKGQQRIGLLNMVASNFFYILKKLMYEDAMLHLCRLTDPPSQGKFENLSLLKLPEVIHERTLPAEVREQLEVVQQKCEFSRCWRDKALAHADLHTWQTENAVLPKVLSTQVEEAIESMRGVLNRIAQHYGCPPVAFLADPFGAQSLVYYLEKAVRVEEQENQRFRKLVDKSASEP